MTRNVLDSKSSEVICPSGVRKLTRRQNSLELCLKLQPETPIVVFVNEINQPT